MSAADVTLITGAGGYLGKQLAAYIRETQPTIPLVADLRCDVSALVALRPNRIYHCAGRTSGSAAQFEESNEQLTESLFRGLHEAGLRPRVVIPGSAAEYGTLPVGANEGFTETSTPHPSGPYGQSKLRQTQIALSWAVRGQDVVVARIFNIIGPSIPPAMAVGAFMKQLQDIHARRQAPRLEVGNLNSLRDYLGIGDVLKALHLIAEKGWSGEIYNICSGVPVAMGDLLKLLIAASGLSVEVASEPQESRSAGTAASWGNSEKLRKVTGWAPSLTLKQAVEDLAARSFGD